MKMDQKTLLHVSAYTLVWVGALNWGLVGLFNLNLVHALFGWMPFLEQLLYLLVGGAAVYTFVTHRNECSVCAKLKK